MLKRWKLTIEYRGTEYYGWQRQPDVPSIQQCLEEAFYKFCQQDISVTVAGRTDAGVHALGQVVHLDFDYGDRALDGYELLKALNYHMQPAPITVIDAAVVDADFHARFSATNKLYRYRILQRPAFPSLERGLLWHFKRPLDTAKMHEGAQFLLGRHDFTTFRDSQCQANSPVKTLDRLDVFEKPYDDHGGREIIVETEGRSFLHHQVRNMVGTLTLVGEGKWKAADMLAALEAKDRTKGGMTAPSDGLYLVRIDYE